MAAHPARQPASNEYDIVIVGAGPAGLMLSACLARWGHKIKHIDDRSEPTPAGRADGIHPRSLELLRNMDLKSAIMANKPARAREVVFWNPPKSGMGIVRTGAWTFCTSSVNARYPFTTVLHQGLIERVLIADMEKSGARLQRPWTFTGFTTDEGEDPEFPVTVDLAHSQKPERETVRARYLFSGEGARSRIRKQLSIGTKYKDPVGFVWGVVDGVVNTDFPDIRLMCTIHSEHGSALLIPRENNMVRLYVCLASSTDPGWNPRMTATEEEIQASARRTLQPYTIEWETVDWYSVYPIRQGIADRYTLDHRVFLGGDACHTHSPKAGQGMNTAFLDSHNLAWKIHLVERGFADRNLLRTYESERREVAEALLAFDNRFARLFSARPSAAAPGVRAPSQQHETKGEEEETEFIRMFKSTSEFMSGYGVAYSPNVLNWSADHPARSHLLETKGTRLRTGHLLINVDVTRVADANVVHLEQAVPLNGSFRILIFAGKPSLTRQALRDFAAHMVKKNSFFSAYLRPDMDRVSHHEAHNPHSWLYTFCTVFAAPRSSIEPARDAPGPLARYREHVYADDRRDQRAPDAEAAGHVLMGLDQERGGVVVVRPDGYVGAVAGLVEGSATVDALNQYFGAFCTKRLGDAVAVL